MLAFMRQNATWLSAGMLMTFSSTFGQTSFIALFGGHIRAEFDLTNGQFGGLYLVGTLASAVLMAVIGKVVDYHSPRKIGVASLVGVTIACIAISISWSLPSLVLAIFLLRFFGQGMMTHVAMTAMGRWFERQRGRAVSITSIGQQIGEAILPITVVTMFGYMHWRTTWQIFAVLLVIIAIPSLFILLSSNRQPQGQIIERDGPQPRQWNRSEVLRDKLFWLTSMGFLAPPFMGTSVFFHQVYLVETKGWQLAWFASGASLFAVTTIIFSLIMGSLVDRYSAKLILPFFLIPTSIALTILAQFDSPYIIPVVMILFGISGGGFNTLFGALWPELYGVKHLGAIRSLIVALMVLFSALGPGVVGGLIDVGITLETQFQTMALYCITVTVMLFGVSKAFSKRQEFAPS